MTDHPIIFSAPMVLALLAGRKTQTRRLGSSPLRRVEVGDRLWVREAWRTQEASDMIAPRDLTPGERIYYACGANQGDPIARLRAAMHMPRWASRLTLTVTDKRVERLRGISYDDARAEGVYQTAEYGWTHDARAPDWWPSPQCGFQHLWDSLHTKEGERWDDNPEVVALTFTVDRRNIDAVRP